MTRLPARQGRLLFAYLVLGRARPIGRDELVEALWPSSAPADPHAALSTLVARLRGVLGAGVLEGRSQLSLSLGSSPWIDVEAAQAAVGVGREALGSGRPLDARVITERALKIVDQPLLLGLDRSWLDESRRHLEGLRSPLLEVMGRACLALGGSALARGIEIGRDLAGLEPYRESAHATLMQLLAAAGDAAEALRVYDDLLVRLRDDLGTSPSPQIATLHRSLLSGTAQHVVAQRVVLPRQLRIPDLAPFVGRGSELATLKSCWDRRSDGPRIALLRGDAGIGKTRLAAEFSRRADADRAIVLYGACDEALAIPYQPFIEALRPCIARTGHDRVASDLGPLARELGRLWPEFAGLGPPMDNEPEMERFMLFEAVTAVLESVAREHHVLLVLDDLHWARPPTILLLRHLIRSQRDLPVMVLVTYRSDEDAGDRPLSVLLGDLHRDPAAEQLDLQGLGLADVVALLEQSAPAHSDDHGPTAAILHDRTAGNPLFLSELLASIGEFGDAQSLAEAARGGEVPTGLRRLIGRRVASLSPAAARTLSFAAVAGTAFSLALIDALDDESRGGIHALDELVERGLIVAAGADGYAFAHAIVRDAIYREIGAVRRMRLHRRVGEALERLGGEDHAEVLAEHFAKAAGDGQSDKAARYALSAGRRAVARLGYEEAIAHCERGLDALSKTPRAHHRLERELLLELSGALLWTGDIQLATQASHQAAELAARLGHVSPPAIQGDY